MADLHPDTTALLELSRQLVEQVQRRDFMLQAQDFAEGDQLRGVVDSLTDPSVIILDLLIVIDNLEKRLVTLSLHGLEGGS